MSNRPTAPDKADLSDPHADQSPAGADTQNPTRLLLVLVRALVLYGRRLAHTLQQRDTAADRAAIAFKFGTDDFALILARITRGLHLANALEARLLDRLARQPRARVADGTVSHCPPAEAATAITTEITTGGPAAGEAESRIARLPTAAAIAAQVRRRPIGAVLADICRELGIVPGNPLWHELMLAIVGNGGNFAALVIDTCERISAVRDHSSATAPQAPPRRYRPFTVAAGAGPP